MKEERKRWRTKTNTGVGEGENVDSGAAEEESGCVEKEQGIVQRNRKLQLEYMKSLKRTRETDLWHRLYFFQSHAENISLE